VFHPLWFVGSLDVSCGNGGKLTEKGGNEGMNV